MYDFQFVTYTDKTLNLALAGSRAFFKLVFPDPSKLRIVSTQVIQEATMGKLHGQVNVTWTVITTIESDEEIIALPLPNSGGEGMKVVN